MLLTLLLSFSAPHSAAAQQGSVQGLVTSASTSAPLEGVAIVLEREGDPVHSTLTDRNGFYQVGGVAPGTYTMGGQALGHLPSRQQVTLTPGARVTVNFALEPDPLQLEGLVVAAEQGSTVRELGRQRITPADMRLVPVPAGTGDLASYLQTLPGVVTTGDRGGHLFVRGGTPAENLVLVDGIPIYQPFHIVGFFSVFPEDLVSSVDFYAGGFGSRYNGRTSSVLDVALRDGIPGRVRTTASVSPFLAEVLVEGPAVEGITWIASARRSLIEETSGTLLGSEQPITFDSQLLKLSINNGDNQRCAALGLRTSDRGRIDPEATTSYVSWSNFVLGGRCVTQFRSGLLRLLEVNFGGSSVVNEAVSQGSSLFNSRIWRLHHDAHATTLLGALPMYSGYHFYTELTEYDLTELFTLQRRQEDVLGIGGYTELGIELGEHVEIRPGVVATVIPRVGVEPRIRANWEPFGRTSEKVEAAFGLYRQDVLGTSDMRDVGSVFTAWMRGPEQRPLESMHALLGWQQVLTPGLRWSLEGYYKRMKQIPVPVWRATTQFSTRLSEANGEVVGGDVRVEYVRRGFFGFLGYGYAETEYVAAEEDFGLWFGDPVERFNPPHDRRHQVNALGTLDLAGFDLSARWQFGSGLPFTRPMGFEDAFDVTLDYYDFRLDPGTSRLVLNRPLNARMPAMHRLDLSLGRGFDLRIGRLTAQVGAINVYDRRNMFYYDLYTGRRVDQLPLAPYASLTLRSR